MEGILMINDDLGTINNKVKSSTLFLSEVFNVLQEICDKAAKFEGQESSSFCPYTLNIYKSEGLVLGASIFLMEKYNWDIRELFEAATDPYVDISLESPNTYCNAFPPHSEDELERIERERSEYLKRTECIRSSWIVEGLNRLSKHDQLTI